MIVTAGRLLTDAGRRHIAQAGFGPVYGARPLRRYISHEVETRIGRTLLRGEVAEGGVVRVDAHDGEPAVSCQAAEAPSDGTNPATYHGHALRQAHRLVIFCSGSSVREKGRIPGRQNYGCPLGRVDGHPGDRALRSRSRSRRCAWMVTSRPATRAVGRTRNLGVTQSTRLSTKRTKICAKRQQQCHGDGLPAVTA